MATDLTPAVADLPGRVGQRGPGLRISTVERDQVITRIENAAADGQLEPAERDARVMAARSAATDAQLAVFVADLPDSDRSASPRVSSADREAVAARLQEAVEGGFLDLTEFDERVRAVYAARLRGELERLVADLPEPAPQPAAPPVEKPRSPDWRHPS